MPDIPEIHLNFIRGGLDRDPVALAQGDADLQRIDRIQPEAAFEQGFIDIDRRRHDALELQRRDDQFADLVLETIWLQAAHYKTFRPAGRCRAPPESDSPHPASWRPGSSRPATP